MEIVQQHTCSYLPTFDYFYSNLNKFQQTTQILLTPSHNIQSFSKIVSLLIDHSDYSDIMGNMICKVAQTSLDTRGKWLQRHSV